MRPPKQILPRYCRVLEHVDVNVDVITNGAALAVPLGAARFAPLFIAPL